MNDTAHNIVQLNQKTVHGSEVAFCIWPIGWSSGLVFQYCYCNNGLYCCRGWSFAEFPDYVTCITILPFRHDTNYYASIIWPLKMGELRAFENPQTFTEIYSVETLTICLYSYRSNENRRVRKTSLDVSTHQLLLSVEDCGNFVSSTEASPSVKEID